MNNQNLPIEIYYDGTLIYKNTIQTRFQTYNNKLDKINYCKNILRNFVPPTTVTTFEEEILSLERYIENNFTYEEIDCKEAALVIYYYAAYHNYKARYRYQLSPTAYGYTDIGIAGHTGCEVLINNAWRKFETQGSR